MKRRLYAPSVLFIGLLSAQIIATAQVYLSNLDLLQATEAVVHSGYLAVPNSLVTDRLDNLTTAMAGGLFFTLSIGAGLSLITLAGAWLWQRVFRRRRREAFLYLVGWIAVLYLINDNGLNVAASTYLIVVPLVTWVAAILLLPARTTLVSPACVLWPVTAAVIVTLLWGLVLDRHLFINLRDHLLLSNRVGRSIANAYYAYTLFPAEAFKSIRQKQIKTCALDGTLDRPVREKLERTLRAYDYLPVPPGYPTDLTIGRDRASTGLSLGINPDRPLTVPVEEMFNHPGKVLADFSDQHDRNRMFRKLTLACLLVGFPLLLYSVVYSVVATVPNFFLTVTQSDMVAAIVCVAIGVLLLMPVYLGHKATVTPADAIGALSSPTLATRTAALKQICRNRKRVAVDARWLALEESPSIAERYWLARSLAYAKGPQAGELLHRLAGDPEPIVACQALWAMGERKNRSVIPRIIDRINTDSHWYIQMYAYRALRTLRWVQPRSPLLSY